MTKLEQVAKAIFDQTFRCPEYMTWEHTSEKMKSEYCSRARAAITAMREPAVNRGELYNLVYQEMIDAALTDHSL